MFIGKETIYRLLSKKYSLEKEYNIGEEAFLNALYAELTKVTTP